MTRSIGLQFIIELCMYWRYYIQCHLSLVDAISTLAQNYPHKKVRKMLQEMEHSLRSGKKLSCVLKLYPKVFDQVFVQLMFVAEQMGDYGPYLEHGEQYLRWRWQFIKLIYDALRYPMILGLLLMVLFGLIHSLLLPQMDHLFHTLGVETYPMMTVMFLGFMRWAPWVGIVLVVGIALLFYGDRCKIPGIGKWVRKMEVMIFAQQLGVLLSGKIDLISSITIASQSTTNGSFYDLVVQRLMEGCTLSRAMEGIDYPGLIQMIELGERTGKLGDILIHYSHMELELWKQSVMGWVNLIQPLLVGVMGALLGGFILCILWPLYEIVTQNG
jgi:type II secretory pathway component PulF